jgi:hypothetical protein
MRPTWLQAQCQRRCRSHTGLLLVVVVALAVAGEVAGGRGLLCCFRLLRHCIDPFVIGTAGLILLATGVQRAANVLNLAVAEAAWSFVDASECFISQLLRISLLICVFVQVWRQAWATLQGGQQGVRWQQGQWQRRRTTPSSPTRWRRRTRLQVIFACRTADAANDTCRRCGAVCFTGKCCTWVVL